MKYRITSLGTICALFVACSVNEMDIAVPSTRDCEEFYATIEDASTKVFADEKLRVLWNADDRVSIFNKYTYNQEYRFSGEDGDNSGSFTKVPNDDFVTGNALDLVYSVYPYHESTKINNDGVITVTLPAEQSYRENSFGQGANTMISVTEDNQLLYKNLCGYLAIKLYGDNVSVISITLRGNNDEFLAGKAIVNASVNEVPSMSFDPSATKEITLSFDNAITLGTTAESATTFWLVVPPTVFSKGFMLTVKDNKNGSFEKVTSKSLEIGRNKLARMAALEVSLEHPNPSDEAIVFADEKVKAKLVAAFDTNGDGELSYREAAAVTSIAGVFDNLLTYTSFDEFQYFTSVKLIPDNTFKDWTLLKSIILPNGITTIGRYAFSGCSSLASIFIPNNVTTIRNSAFRNCSNLVSINIPNSLSTIPDGAFFGCSSLATISIPESVTSIGDGAFSDCSSLTSITIPNTVTCINSSTFYNCKSLTLVSIPNSVTLIKSYAFQECSGLVSISIPNNVNSIGKYAFCNCSSLSSISIPEPVSVIESGTFSGCTSLKSILFSGTLTSIGEAAFLNCLSLSSFEIPNSITEIPNQAFAGCSSLSSIILSSCVNSIGESAFYNCSGLSSIISYAIIPPSGTTYMFLNTNNCPIYVPASSVEVYKAAQYWSDYADRIQAMAPLPEAIDLGLSVKWASFNLGATKPEEYGDYYAWGETETKNDYSLATYKWCVESEYSRTKYCTNSNYGHNGFTDGKTVLDPEDDIAYVKLKGNWRIPTHDEWTELRNGCTWTWTTENGVCGRKITSKTTGNSIFLPAAGFRSGVDLDSANSLGRYWSSSLHESDQRSAWCLSFYSGNVMSAASGYTYFGYSIRPVYAE